MLVDKSDLLNRNVFSLGQWLREVLACEGARGVMMARWPSSRSVVSRLARPLQERRLRIDKAGG
jgi:hypothetical protein